MPPVILRFECLKNVSSYPSSFFFFFFFFGLLGSEMFFPFLDVILLIFLQAAAAVLDSFGAIFVLRTKVNT